MGLSSAQLSAMLCLITICTWACSLCETIPWRLASLQAMSMKTMLQRPLMWLHSSARALRARPTLKVAGALCAHGADHRLLHGRHKLQLHALPPQGGCLEPEWRLKRPVQAAEVPASLPCCRPVPSLHSLLLKAPACSCPRAPPFACLTALPNVRPGSIWPDLPGPHAWHLPQLAARPCCRIVFCTPKQISCSH